jgi:hypothetical protein
LPPPPPAWGGSPFFAPPHLRSHYHRVPRGGGGGGADSSQYLYYTCGPSAHLKLLELFHIAVVVLHAPQCHVLLGVCSCWDPLYDAASSQPALEPTAKLHTNP